MPVRYYTTKALCDTVASSVSPNLERTVLDFHNSYVMTQHMYEYIYIQGVPGGMCQTSGGCSLC